MEIRFLIRAIRVSLLLCSKGFKRLVRKFGKPQNRNLRLLFLLSGFTRRVGTGFSRVLDALFKSPQTIEDVG